MRSTHFTRAGWLRRLALTAVALSLLAIAPALARAAAPVRVVGCSTASLSPALVASGITLVTQDSDDDEGETDDQDEENQEPKIVGSIPKPRGVSEDDSKKLEPLATVSKDQAIWNASAAVANPGQRRVRKVQVEGENGYVVWSVKTELVDPNSGPDPKLELKLDAGGNGDVLSIECEADDD